VLRTLPRLQKLDDVEVSEEERRTAMRQAQDLVHPEDEEGQSWSQQVPAYSSQDHNGYSNGGKYEVKYKVALFASRLMISVCWTNFVLS
jgi:hypothetical protein